MATIFVAEDTNIHIIKESKAFNNAFDFQMCCYVVYRKTAANQDMPSYPDQ